MVLLKSSRCVPLLIFPEPEAGRPSYVLDTDTGGELNLLIEQSGRCVPLLILPEPEAGRLSYIWDR